MSVFVTSTMQIIHDGETKISSEDYRKNVCSRNSSKDNILKGEGLREQIKRSRKRQKLVFIKVCTFHLELWTTMEPF